MECYFLLKEGAGISNEIRSIVFKKLTLEFLCDITRILKESHCRVLNPQGVLFAIVLYFTESSPANCRCQLFTKIATEAVPGLLGDNRLGVKYDGK